MLPVNVLIVVLDALASEVPFIDETFGVDTSDPNTIAGGSAVVRDALAEINDASVQVELTPVFARRTSLVLASVLYPAMQGAMLHRALDRHLGGLNEFLRTNDVRVHPNLRKMGFMIDTRNTFRPTALEPVARYEGSGAGTGIFLAGSDIDTSEYGEAAMEVVVEAMGADARTLRLTMKKFDGTTESKDVVIPADTPVDAAFPVGAAGDRYIGVETVSTFGGGGSAGDEFKVRSVVERVIP